MPQSTFILLVIIGLFSILGVMALAADDEQIDQTTAPATDPVPPDPVAVVNGVPISRAFYEAYAQQRQAQLRGNNTKMTRQTLTNELVIQELLVQEAEKKKLAEDAQVALQIEMMGRNLLASAGIQKMLQAQIPSEEDIKREYEATTARMNLREYKARHILVDSEDKAKALIEELAKGADFAELAKTHSSDPSAARGGDLGWVTPDITLPAFSQAMSQLEAGKFSEKPVKTQFGWHVIKLDDTRTAAPPSLEEMRPQIAQTLRNRIIESYLQELREAADIEIK